MPLSQAERRTGGPACGLPGRAWEKCRQRLRVNSWRLRSGLQSPPCPLPQPGLPGPGLTPSLLAPPAQAAAPAGHRTRPAALRPQTRSGFRSPPSRQGRVLGSTPSPARLPRRFAQNIPSICPLPGILLGPGPARLKSFPPDPLLGRSSRNSGLACHGSYQLLSSPT